MWTTICLSAAFLSLFAAAEILYRRWHVQAEHTRKLVHAGTGLLTLLFPLLLNSHWQVLFLCGSFALILLITQRTGLLPSIHAIRRTSHGSICYPTVVYLVFGAYEWASAHSTGNISALLYFYIPILIMALCDPAAALIGRKWPVWKFRVGAGTKSLAGSAAFFVSAFSLAAMLLLVFPSSDWAPSRMLAHALTLGAVTCATEAFTPNGFDNLTIPIAAFITLYTMSHL